MATLKLSTLLERIDACLEARAWALTQPNLQTAWTNCKRSDWMIWLLDRTTIDFDSPKFRLMACDFAEPVLHLVAKGENRPKAAIEIARKFANGEATREEMAAARDAAGAARAAGDARAAAWAAGAAVREAAWAAAWVAGAAARAAARAAQSDIIRKYFPKCPRVKHN